MPKPVINLDLLVEPQQPSATAPINLDRLQEPAPRPTALQAVAEPFKRVASGLAALPGQAAAGVRAVPEVDWWDVVRHPGELGTAIAETYGPAMPEIVGAGVGAFAGVPGLIVGPIAGRGIYEAGRQILTGEPQAPLETLTRMATAGVGGATSLVPGAAQRVVHPLRGRFTPRPGVADIAERQGVDLSLADATGSKFAGQMENIAGSLPGGTGPIQAFQEAQRLQQGAAFGRAVERLGPTESRALTGQRAVQGLTEGFERAQAFASNMQQGISRIVGDDVIPIPHTRAAAAHLAQRLREVKYPSMRDQALIRQLDEISVGYQPAPVAGGAPAVAAAPKIPDPLTVSDSVSKLVGRGMQPPQAGRLALEGLLRDGFAEEASVSAVNQALKEATGRIAVPLSQETITAARRAVGERPTLAPVVRKPGAGPEGMTLSQWWATQTAFGEAGRDLHLLTNQQRGVYQQLYSAIQKDLEAWTPRPEVRAAVTHFKEYYKNQVVPFNKSAVGRLAAGLTDPEYAGRLFGRDALTELQNLKRYASPEIFAEVRNRGLADLFEKQGVSNPQTGFQPGAFRKAWNSIDPEVKTRGFTKQQIADFDDLATLAERIGAKKTAAGGGSPSGTPLAQAPMLQAGATFTAGGRLVRSALTGDVAGMALSAGALGTAMLSPRLLARWVTNPGAIRKLTTAMQVPPGSRAGMAFLGEISAFRQANPEE